MCVCGGGGVGLREGRGSKGTDALLVKINEFLSIVDTI